MQKRITVLGGGPGGYVAAIKAAQAGGEVTLIEKERLGGTCLNWGCIPTKAYAEKISLVNPPDLKSVKQNKDLIVSQLVKGVETLIGKNKINLYQGLGQVLSPRKVLVQMAGEQKVVENDYLILATGSQTSWLDIPGLELPQVVDSQGILQLEEKPQHLAIIGGGVIGIEFAQIFARLGSKVTIVEYLPRILADFDQEMVRRLQPVLRRTGIEILTNSSVQEIRSARQNVEVLIEGPEESNLPVDLVLFAAGRKPNLQGISAKDLGLQLEGAFIRVNKNMQTNLPQVYAIGDLVPTPMLAHLASYEGEIAVRNIFGEKVEADYSAVPASIFTQPELATVGLSETQAQQAGLEYRVGKFPFTANGRAVTKEENYGQVKIIGDQTNARVLGAQILGPGASELIQILTLAVRWRLTVDQLTETIYGHPTLSEAILEGAQSVFGRPTHFL